MKAPCSVSLFVLYICIRKHRNTTTLIYVLRMFRSKLSVKPKLLLRITRGTVRMPVKCFQCSPLRGWVFLQQCHRRSCWLLWPACLSRPYYYQTPRKIAHNGRLSCSPLDFSGTFSQRQGRPVLTLRSLSRSTRMTSASSTSFSCELRCQFEVSPLRMASVSVTVA